MAWRIKLPLVFLAFAFLLHTTSAKQKPINIALSGKWKSTPLLLETSEFFGKESNDLFWRFVDHVADQGHDYFELASDEVKYDFIRKYAEGALSPLQLSFLKFSLSLRAFSPAIQMFQQLAEQIPSTKSCSAFIEVNGEFSCDTNSLSELLTTSITRSPTPIYKFDHMYPGKAGGKSTVVILYTELGTNAFKEFHPALAQLAKMGEITYCIRHFVKDVHAKDVRLSGYGVELAIKSTEYKAKDDTKVEGEGAGDAGEEDDEGEEVNGLVFSKLRELHPELKNELKELRNHLMDSATELMPFKVWQLQDLGYQACQKIMSVSSSDSLQYLRDISQNFPTQARSLVRQSVTNEFRKEVKRNQQAFERMGLMPGTSTLYLNGLSVDLETYDVFTLLDVMTSEASLVEGLHSLGYQGDKLQKLLQLDLREGNDQSYAVDIRHTAVQFLNDLSSDKVYRSWPNSVQDLLRPSFPGMLRHVAKNLFHLVFVVDPAKPESKSLLKMAEAFLVHKAPLRLGLVFVCDSDSKTEKADGFSSPCVAFTRAYNFILMDQGKASSGLSFITDVFQKVGSKELTSEAIVAEFNGQYPDEDKDLVFGDDSDYDDIRKAGADFVSRIGLSGLPQVLINGVPLDGEQIKVDNFEESVVMEVLKQTQTLQTAVYKGEVSDHTDILEWWMERDNVLPRLNSRILAPATKRLDFTGSFGEDPKKLTPSQTNRLDSKTLTALIGQRMRYLTRKDEDSVRPVTIWVVADLETVEGRDIVYSALKNLKTTSNVRLGVVFNPSETSQDKNKNTINKAVHVALQTLSMPLAKSLVTKLVKEENVQALRDGSKTLRDLEVHGMDTDAYMKALEADMGHFLKIDQTFASRVLSLSHGERAVITNGAVLGPLSKDEEMSVEDFNLLEKVATNQGAGKIQEALSLLRGANEENKNSNAVMKVSNLLLSKGKQEKRHKVEFEADIHSVVKLEPDTTIPAFTIDAVLNPISREAQKLSSILMVMKEIANVDVRIYLNPLDKLSEMPLKSFYRYVLEPEVTFNSEGVMNDGPSARFLDMPQKSLLTLNMDTPESWMVQAVTSPYDLDNILLEEVERSVIADFELEYLLLEGHCHDATTMQPPRGLQFVLGTNGTEDLMDTIVMANLGYFQLKANPGLWQLSLREGRSKEIYNIDSHEHTDTPDGLSDVIIGISSLKSKTIRVKVSKKPDKADQSLLQDDSGDEGGLWDSFTNTFSGSTKTEEEKDSTLNIFSVASGHLYERFLRIMMLSVLKNTQSKVKFWFLKNFLSPSFKDFIPYMAQEYGFEYELVQYKWPHWLNQQKEKQRIIWGYKILFLDVLFPLDVKKIIFVDADQIVRADLQELHDLDLGGAPYGYTPFCDSKREMDGFRFWNSGYWKSHLAGRKYHISALYVIDLKRFRRIAAGDRLRGQYQGLSQDPNSLANLDQDLPNNMIHQVSIKSLPQEWLYCETWCSESTKAQAKTIDLCNNPLTKEPKLKAAMRIVPEWKNYDYEVKVLWDEIYDTDTKSQIEYDPPEVSTQDSRRKVKEEL